MNSFVILQLPASSGIGEQKTIRVCPPSQFRICCYSMREYYYANNTSSPSSSSCVFDRSMKLILLEHIQHHDRNTYSLCHVKIASSYRITYLCRIINVVEGRKQRTILQPLSFRESQFNYIYNTANAKYCFSKKKERMSMARVHLFGVARQKAQSLYTFYLLLLYFQFDT